MILVDTSVWVDHFRKTGSSLKSLLLAEQVLMHPFILGELALGNFKNRTQALSALSQLPHTIVANESEVMQFIERHKLFGLGIGYIDAHLLVSARISSTFLWTHDKKLHDVAATLGLTRN